MYSQELQTLLEPKLSVSNKFRLLLQKHIREVNIADLQEKLNMGKIIKDKYKSN
jgi:hypothetical protein